MFNTFEFPAKLGDQLPTRCLDEIQNRDSLASASILPRTRYDRLEARAQKWLHRPDTWHEEPNKIDDSSFVGVLECTAASFRQLLRVMGFAQVQENLGDADVQGKVANQNNLASLNIDEGDERTESIGERSSIAFEPNRSFAFDVDRSLQSQPCVSLSNSLCLSACVCARPPASCYNAAQRRFGHLQCSEGGCLPSIELRELALLSLS